MLNSGAQGYDIATRSIRDTTRAVYQKDTKQPDILSRTYTAELEVEAIYTSIDTPTVRIDAFLLLGSDVQILQTPGVPWLLHRSPTADAGTFCWCGPDCGKSIVFVLL